MKAILFLLLFGLSLATQAQENYCHEAETNEYWEDLKERAKDNYHVVHLANYRKNLCEQVENGELTVDEATDLFEYQRAVVLDKLER